MRRDRTRPLSQVEVEAELLDQVEHLEALTNGDEDLGIVGYDQVCEAAADAEVEWKLAFAREMLTQANRGSKERRDLQESRATTIHAEAFRAYKLRGAQKDAAKEALVTTRTKIDALRTIAANVRAQT